MLIRFPTIAKTTCGLVMIQDTHGLQMNVRKRVECAENKLRRKKPYNILSIKKELVTIFFGVNFVPFFVIVLNTMI